MCVQVGRLFPMRLLLRNFFQVENKNHYVDQQVPAQDQALEVHSPTMTKSPNFHKTLWAHNCSQKND